MQTRKGICAEILSRQNDFRSYLRGVSVWGSHSQVVDFEVGLTCVPRARLWESSISREVDPHILRWKVEWNLPDFLLEIQHPLRVECMTPWILIVYPSKNNTENTSFDRQLPVRSSQYSLKIAQFGWCFEGVKVKNFPNETHFAMLIKVLQPSGMNDFWQMTLTKSYSADADSWINFPNDGNYNT